LPGGATMRHPVHIVDWMPTLLRLVGYETNSEDFKFDGRDIWPLLRRAADKNLPPLTLPSALLFRCAGRGEGTFVSAARFAGGLAAGRQIFFAANSRYSKGVVHL